MSAEETTKDPEAQTDVPAATETDPLVPSEDTEAGGAAPPEDPVKKEEEDVVKPSSEVGTLTSEMKDIIVLGFPIFLAMVSWVGMKTTDTALLGHVSADALSASALADLWTMTTAVLIQGRVLGVLTGAAIGAGNPKLAGIYLQVSYFVISFLVVLVFITWNFTGAVWKAFGADPKIAEMAGYYASVLAWSLPGQMAFSQLSQFFSSQMITYPEANVSSVGLVMNLVLGLFFVLGFPVEGWDGYGFAACPIVTTSVTYIQLFLLWFIYIYIQKLHEPCWGGWAWSEVTWTRIKTFVDLYFPAALGMASDFWRVAVIGAIAATLGELDVAVFNSSYRIMWVVLIAVNALSTAAGIKMTLRLGDMNYDGAKHAGYLGISMSVVFLVAVGGLVYFGIRPLGRIFTEDPEFIEVLAETVLPFTITLVFMNLAVAIERIPYAMGRTTEVFWFGLIASWGAQVPAVYFLVKYWKEDLSAVYWGMAAGYFVLCILYSYITFTSDWKYYAELARERSEMESPPDVK